LRHFHNLMNIRYLCCYGIRFWCCYSIRFWCCYSYPTEPTEPSLQCHYIVIHTYHAHAQVCAYFSAPASVLCSSSSPLPSLCRRGAVGKEPSEYSTNSCNTMSRNVNFHIQQQCHCSKAISFFAYLHSMAACRKLAERFHNRRIFRVPHSVALIQWWICADCPEEILQAEVNAWHCVLRPRCSFFAHPCHPRK
jgi:hypothetical protein